MLLVGLGRVIQDLLLWCTMEFGYLRLSDGFVQGSSIMPQKRNPVALEHARAIASKAVGQAQAIGTAVHNTPFGDIVDTEDDLQPLVASMFRDATRAVTLVAAAMRGADFNVARLAEPRRCGRDDADGAGRHAGARSRPAVPLGARASRQLPAEGPDRGSRRRRSRPRCRRRRSALLGRALDYTEEQLEKVMSPRHFVEVRTTYGGPAPSETARALSVSRAEPRARQSRVAAAARRPAAAERALRDRVAAL